MTNFTNLSMQVRIRKLVLELRRQSMGTGGGTAAQVIGRGLTRPHGHCSHGESGQSGAWSGAHRRGASALKTRGTSMQGRGSRVVLLEDVVLGVDSVPGTHEID